MNTRMNEVEHALRNLADCPYSFPTLHRVLEDLQAKLDDMQMKGYANFTEWVSGLDARVERVLARRLSLAIVTWSKTFLRWGKCEHEDATGTGTSTSLWKTEEEEDGDSPEAAHRGTLEPVVHRITVLNQMLTVTPSLQESRTHWIGQVNAHAYIVTALPRLNTSRYAVFSTFGDSEARVPAQRDYSSLLRSDSGHVNPAVLMVPLRVIEAAVQRAEHCCAQWLSYQLLWDAPIASIDDAKLGSDLALWSKLLEEMRLARSTTLELSLIHI